MSDDRTSDGGAAFPHDEFTKDGNHYKVHDGLSKLEYFAGKALANSAIAHSDLDNTETAVVCCRQALAMLAELERIQSGAAQ